MQEAKVMVSLGPKVVWLFDYEAMLRSRRDIFLMFRFSFDEPVPLHVHNKILATQTSN